MKKFKDLLSAVPYIDKNPMEIVSAGNMLIMKGLKPDKKNGKIYFVNNLPRTTLKEKCKELLDSYKLLTE